MNLFIDVYHIKANLHSHITLNDYKNKIFNLAWLILSKIPVQIYHIAGHYIIIKNNDLLNIIIVKYSVSICKHTGIYKVTGG